MHMQAAKVYVQDRLRSQADLVWQLINDRGAHFYVCGDASSMAGAVSFVGVGECVWVGRWLGVRVGVGVRVCVTFDQAPIAPLVFKCK